MTTKMKGLLKGLRYISQIFDEDKEPEMQIGFPTDVKHVAHIGCDGPSVNSPSWMDSFKPDQDSMSGPLAADCEGLRPGFGLVSEMLGYSKRLTLASAVSVDSSLKGSLHGSSPARDLPDMPRSSRRSSGEIFSTDSSMKEKSEKTSSRHSRKSRSGGGSKELSDNSSSGRSSSRSQPLSESAPGSESPSHGLPDIPKKSRRKKSKDSSQGGSSKSSSRTAKAIAEASTYTSPFSDPGSGSVSTDLYSCPSPDLQRSDEANDRNRLNGFA